MAYPSQAVITYSDDHHSDHPTGPSIDSIGKGQGFGAIKQISMAHLNVPDPYQRIPCPYDRREMILVKNMQKHLMQCGKNHPGHNFAVCYFNARHIVPRPDLRHHMDTCPDKCRIEPDILHEQSRKNGTYLKGNTDLPDYSHSDHVESVENWETEIPSVARTGVPAGHFSKLDRHDTAGQHLNGEERVEEEDRNLRMPHHKPPTYMGAMGQGGAHPQPSSIYAYSLSMSGIGRGQQVGRGRGNTFESAGRGRGRAAGCSVLNFPGQSTKINGYMSKPLNTNCNGNATPAGPVCSGGEMNSSNPVEHTTPSEEKVDIEAARARDRRRLEKKLRQIELLEKKVAGGYKLTTEEEIKVENKKDIVATLNNLRV